MNKLEIEIKIADPFFPKNGTIRIGEEFFELKDGKCFRLVDNLPNEIYQPIKGNLDSSNSPKSGSGVPKLQKEEKCKKQ